MADDFEREIARIIRDVENGGRYIHGMMPEAAARAVTEYIHSGAMIQALKFYADNYIDGGSKARMALEKLGASLKSAKQ